MNDDRLSTWDDGENDDERYTFCCQGCGDRVSPGQALRGGKIICISCSGEVPLPVSPERFSNHGLG